MRHQSYERVQPLELVSGIINYEIALALTCLAMTIRGVIASSLPYVIASKAKQSRKSLLSLDGRGLRWGWKDYADFCA